MTWSYRIVKIDNYYGLHEAFYDENGTTILRSVNPITFVSDSSEGLIASLEMALDDAKSYPVFVDAVEQGQPPTKPSDDLQEKTE